MKDILVKIRFLIPSLPRAEKAIAEALAEHPEAITYMTLSEISKESGSSEASVIRFCKRMGFGGYSALQQAIAEAMEGADETHAEELQVSHEDSMYEIIQKVYQSNVQTLTDTMVLVSEQCERALEALLAAKSIHFFGAGDAYAVCQLAYMKFKRLGIPCSAEGDIMLQMITASNMSQGMWPLPSPMTEGPRMWWKPFGLPSRWELQRSVSQKRTKLRCSGIRILSCLLQSTICPLTGRR